MGIGDYWTGGPLAVPSPCGQFVQHRDVLRNFVSVDLVMMGFLYCGMGALVGYSSVEESDALAGLMGLLCGISMLFNVIVQTIEPIPFDTQQMRAYRRPVAVVEIIASVAA